MNDQVPVIDLFSGPGGLAEGFAALFDSDGQPRFNIVLSIEMDAIAYRTLRLRGFLRKFPSGFPPEYYDFLNGVLTEEPDWARLYPQEWQKACDETRCLKLGTPEATTFVKKRIGQIRNRYGDKTVLLGGPPCQSYSVAGRARNVGNAAYDATKDERQSLYREYAEVLAQLQPAVAVMENVKGMLSAQDNGKPIFSNVMDSLMHAGGKDRYRLFSLTSPCENQSWGKGLSPKDFLVRAEENGIPQKRHRVFVICIRHDIAASMPSHLLPKLDRNQTPISVHDVIGIMPTLRSRLSREDDDVCWQRAVLRAYKLIQKYRPIMERDQEERFDMALDRALKLTIGSVPPNRDATGGTALPNSCPAILRDWIFDRNLTKLPNNETRGHIDEDIARYLYASAFAFASGRSPRTFDFPQALAAKHKSWNTGKFDDRFRVQLRDHPSTTITSHISKDGHYFIHPDPAQCRSLTVREAARLQTFPDNYFFHGGRTQQYIQVGNAVPPFLALQIAGQLLGLLDHHYRISPKNTTQQSAIPHKGSTTEASPIFLGRMSA